MAGREPVYTARRRNADKATDKVKPAAASSPKKKPAARTNAAAKKENTQKKPNLRQKTEKKRPDSSSCIKRRESTVKGRRSEDKRSERAVKSAAMRDRRKVALSTGGFPVALMALLTAGFETLGFLLLTVRTAGTVDTQALALLAAVVPLGLATTLVLPRFAHMDALTMALTNFICGVGLVILYTVSPWRGVRQTVFYAAGLGVMMVMCAIVSRLRRPGTLTVLSMVLGIGALALPLLFGSWQNGAKNWVEVPYLGSFQPSELVKLCLVLSLAYYFSTHRTVMQMMPAILFAGACLAMLMLQRDLGTALIYYLTTVVMFYAACGNVPLTALGLLGGVGAAVMGYEMFAHVKVRVAMWQNPWSDPLDKGYQIIQALLAISSGGLFGVGLGQGTPEKIPMYYNDFIFAVICEQLGLVFGLALLAVYAALIMRCVSVAMRSRRSFDLLLGCGVAALLGIQTFMIVGGVIKMIPLTGVTMPFISYGGSSLISCMAMIGIIHGIAGRAQREISEDLFGIEAN